MVENLQQFLNEAVGQKYKMNTHKLMKKQTCKDIELYEDRKQKLLKDDRTFFCSELVAKAFKILGII